MYGRLKLASDLLCWTILIIASSVRIGAGQPLDRRPIPWPDETAVAQKLELPVSVTWSKSPLRGSLQRFGRTQQLGVFLDRRIDPDQRVELAIVDEPLRVALGVIASSANCGVSKVGTTFYFGPKETCDNLATLAAMRRDEMKSLDEQLRRRVGRIRSWEWDELATPRALVEELCKEAKVQLPVADRIPHDLWPAYELPPMHWADRLTLVLAGFNLTYRVDAKSEAVELLPWPAAADIALERRFKVGDQVNALVRRIGIQLPKLRLKTADGELIAIGKLEDHERLNSLLPGAKPPGKVVKRTTTTGQRYTLSVKDVPLRELLEHFEQKLKLEISIDRPSLTAAGVSLDHPVAVTVEKATLEELLLRSLVGTKLAFEIDGATVRIYPAATE